MNLCRVLDVSGFWIAGFGSFSLYFSRVFVVMKSSGAWRSVIDLSCLNTHVKFLSFHIETPQLVLSAVQPGDWMMSVDLKDAYLQVLIHPDSRHLLCFVILEGLFLFKVMCFGLMAAPEVFMRVTAPISVLMYWRGYRILCYLYNWLILISSEQEVLESRDYLLWLCQTLGIPYM